MNINNEVKTFETFIEDSSNKFAVAACKAIVGGVDCYNPLVLYGETGIGKTHLLMAIKNAVVEKFPDKKVCYITVEELVSEFIQMLREEKNEKLGEKCYEYDVILVDGLEYLAGKEATQTEVLHFINRLWCRKKQIVLTSLIQPQKLSALFDRFDSRFFMGLLCDIAPASYELKLQYAERSAVELGIKLSNEAIALLAKRFSRVAPIKGAIMKLKMLNSQGVLLEDWIKERRGDDNG